MWIDPIVEEIRLGRNEHAARLDCDSHRLYAELIEHEQIAKARGVRFVSLQPRPTTQMPAQISVQASL